MFSVKYVCVAEWTKALDCKSKNYTAGSNPATYSKNGRLVEWLTIPPCHGAWCEFESRSDRFEIIWECRWQAVINKICAFLKKSCLKYMLESTNWLRYPDFQSEKCEFESRLQYKMLP